MKLSFFRKNNMPEAETLAETNTENTEATVATKLEKRAARKAKRQARKEAKAKKTLPPKVQKVIDFMNKFSLLFHALLSLVVIFAIEWISHRSFASACTFVSAHFLAYLYNAFIIFASLCIVYLFRRRTFFRVIITCFWVLLGIINGCILSNRVSPFGYTDMKCISDLLSMSDTNYFTAAQATMVVVGLCILLALLVLLFIFGPKYKGKINYIVVPISLLAVFFIAIPITTSAAQSTNVVASYYANLAEGYEDYGFVYSFATSVLDRGMDKPSNYSEEAVDEIESQVSELTEETSYVTGDVQPNIICVLLESFCDPDEINFLEVEGDPIPTFHYLEENFTTGYLTVPVVGAGTCNTEMEVLTGMSMQYFGTGELPYKTILKKTDCESSASDLTPLGYTTHVVHNNGANFYSRKNAFAMFGFDTFTSKEMMDITEWTPLGSWAKDDILVDETVKAMDTTEGADYTYIITVSSHGDYPDYEVLDEVNFPISGVEDEGEAYQWTYYVNQLNAVDTFMAELIEEMSNRDEPTIIVFFGDHLPTMGLEDEDMVSGDIYKTKYVTWNNFGLEKEDKDLYSYQLMASVFDSIGIHEGTIFQYHQTMMDTQDDEDGSYLLGLEMLQYDILYGERYVYDGEDAYPATDIEMGVEDVVITAVENNTEDGKVYIYGENFTNWSRVYVNGEKVSCKYVDGNTLTIKKDSVSEGDTIVVQQMGSSNTVLRASNEVIYEAPTESEASEMEENVNTTETETEDLYIIE